MTRYMVRAFADGEQVNVCTATTEPAAQMLRAAWQTARPDWSVVIDPIVRASTVAELYQAEQAARAA